MSTGYLILYYKNNMIESYIRNFLMTKYISLNNAMGSGTNKLISKIKYQHRNYFCFINKEKNKVRCIIKLNKITNYQINLEIKSQQEISLQDLKNSEIFKNEGKIIENFFNLENNNNTNYINNKINLLIKESNNVYEFNCILLENSFDMGIFEKIKRCMKDKENNHNNEIQNNLRNNPFISNILNYQAAFRKKNQENNNNKGINNTSGSNLNNIISKEGDDRNSNKEMNFFDMKYDKYFLYDELLIDKNENNDIFFPKNHIAKYNELENNYKEIFKVADTIFIKPFSKLDEVKDEIIFNKSFSTNNNELNNLNNSSNTLRNKETNRINSENNNINKNINLNEINASEKNLNRNNNNISIMKDDIVEKEGIKDKITFKKSNDNYINYKKESNYMNNNYNRDYNYNYKYYNSNNDNNKYNIRNNINNIKKIPDKQYRDSGQIRNNSYNSNNNYINSSRNDDMRNYSNNYNSSNNSSYTSERGRNYSRSRERSPISSPNNNMRYRVDSPPQKKYEKYDRYNDRNSSYKNNNNYYGNNNNINYYYNINNYYRPGSINRWNDNPYHHQGGNYQRDNYQQNKNEYFNNNYEGHYNRERRRGSNQNSNY